MAAAKSTPATTEATAPAEFPEPKPFPEPKSIPAPKPMNPASTVPVKSEKFSPAELLKIKSARAWRPNSGNTIEGEIVAVVKRTGEYGPYPCVILETGDNDKFTAVHAFHGVLQNEMREMGVKRGDTIMILYTGKREANKLNADGSTKNYHGYSVVPTEGGTLDVYDF